MKKYILILSVALTTIASCNVCKNLDSSIPQTGSITIPAKANYTMFKNIEHCSFSITLTNSNSNQSCEAYYVKENGKEKWINPSLMANKSLTFTIPKNGYMLLKNFNPNDFTITYKIN
jgi:hypothetical protein